MSEILHIRCISCETKKPTTEFYRDKYTKSGYKSRCKECVNNQKVSFKRKKDVEKEDDDKTVKVAKIEGRSTENTIKSSAKTGNLTDNVYTNSYVGPNPMPSSSAEIHTDYPEFDWEVALAQDKHFSIADCAPRNSGKTTTISYLWPLFKRRYHAVIFFCQSLKAEIYKSFLTENDRRFCFPTFNEDLLTDLKLLQDATENAFHFLILFDDDVDFNAHKNNRMMVNIYTKGRNDNMTIWFSTQSAFAINSNARENIDYLILRRPRTPAMREKIAEQFLFDIVPAPPECNTRGKKLMYINQWIDVNTRDYNSIVIDYLNDSKIYKFKAEPNKSII